MTWVRCGQTTDEILCHSGSGRTLSQKNSEDQPMTVRPGAFQNVFLCEGLSEVCGELLQWLLILQNYWIKITGCFSTSLTDECRSDAPPALLLTPHLGEVQHSIMGDGQTIAVTITFRRCNTHYSIGPELIGQAGKKTPYIMSLRNTGSRFNWVAQRIVTSIVAYWRISIH